MEAACQDAGLDCRVWTWPAEKKWAGLEYLPNRYLTAKSNVECEMGKSKQKMRGPKFASDASDEK